MLAKRFFYVSAAMLMLALTYHFGANAAGAQGPGNPVVGIAHQSNSNGGYVALTSNGDSYFTGNYGTTWEYRGNVFGAPTNTTEATWGKVKSAYRK